MEPRYQLYGAVALLLISLMVNAWQFDENARLNDTCELIAQADDPLGDYDSQEESVSIVFFRNHIPSARSNGTVVLRNDGTAPLDPDAFSVLLNKKPQGIGGCYPNEPIEPELSCRLFFFETCEPGDLFEVEYAGTRVYSKTC